MKVEFLHTRFPLVVRFIIAFFFYTLVALLHILMVRGGSLPLFVLRFAGIGLLLIPLWFLKTRNFSNKPMVDKPKAGKVKASKRKAPVGNNDHGQKQKETWKFVSMTEIDRLRDWIGTLRKVKIPFFYSMVFGALATFIISILIIFSVIIAVFTGSVGFFIVLDIFLIFFPLLYFARIEKWVPAISGKLDAFAPVLDAKLPDSLRLDITIFPDGDKGDKIPSDLRLMLAPAMSAPQEVRDELLGAQFQVTFNRGPNGEVPYLYAVFITKGKEKIWQTLKDIRAPGYVTEAGSSTEEDVVYGTVVLRLDTKSRSDGYHTHESDVREILHLVIQALEKFS